MENLQVCCLCLTRDDLIRVTKEKEKLIYSLLEEDHQKDLISRICINCSSSLSCLDKFSKNSRAAHKILKQERASLQIQNNFLDVPSATQDKVTDSFDIILNWLTSVNVVLERYPFTKDQEVPMNKNSRLSSADTIIISSVHSKDFVSGDFFPEYIKEEEEEIIEDYDYFDAEQISSYGSHQMETKGKVQNEVPKKEPKTREILTNENQDLEKYYVYKKVNGKSQYKCPECKKLFERKELKYHFNLHKGVTPFKCIVKGCSKAYISPYLAAGHCKSSHNLNVGAKKWTGFDARKLNGRRISTTQVSPKFPIVLLKKLTAKDMQKYKL